MAEQDKDVCIRQTNIIFSTILIFSLPILIFFYIIIPIFLVRLWFWIFGLRKPRKQAMQCRTICTINKSKFYLKDIKIIKILCSSVLNEKTKVSGKGRRKRERERERENEWVGARERKYVCVCVCVSRARARARACACICA